MLFKLNIISIYFKISTYQMQSIIREDINFLVEELSHIFIPS